MSPRIIDRFSVAACPVSIRIDCSTVGAATGFFYNSESRIFFVSNWHVFSGREPKDGQPKDKRYGAIPNNIVVEYHPRARLDKTIKMSLNLYSDDGSSTWIQHHIHGQNVDIAAINVSELTHQKNDDFDPTPFVINEMEQVTDMALPMGSDVFVLGFPLGIRKTGILPIWKRASVASEMAVEVDGYDCFIIDTATREGMSGSPVLARGFGSYMSTSGGQKIGGISDQFLGIYSGRYIGNIDEAHLGIVWKLNLIEEILKSGSIGSYEIK